MDDDPRPLHQTALADADALIRRVDRLDLNLPTPCAGWNLADLLAHMIGQHRGFANAVRDGTALLVNYQPHPYTADSWRQSATALLTAFADADLDAEAVIVELAPTALRVRQIVRAQLLDTVAHTWDLARTLGQSYVPSTALTDAVTHVAATIPDRARLPGAVFGPKLPITGTTWEHALALLGRDPSWTAG